MSYSTQCTIYWTKSSFLRSLSFILFYFFWFIYCIWRTYVLCALSSIKWAYCDKNTYFLEGEWFVMTKVRVSERKNRSFHSIWGRFQSPYHEIYCMLNDLAISTCFFWSDDEIYAYIMMNRIIEIKLWEVHLHSIWHLGPIHCKRLNVNDFTQSFSECQWTVNHFSVYSNAKWSSKQKP